MLNDPGPLLREPHQHACTPNCGRPLQVQKTVTRTVVDADRLLPITEVYRHCPRHESRAFVPYPITPPKCIYTFDLIVLVGQRRFLAHKQFSEIHDDLAERGIPVPPRTLEWLADRFTLYTVAVHVESLTLLAKKLVEQGGYVLLNDGMGKAGRMVLQLTDGWGRGVLISATVPNESQEALVQREGPGLLLMENLRDTKYVRLVYGTLARQGARFAQVKEETLVAAGTLTGLSAGSPIAGNH